MKEPYICFGGKKLTFSWILLIGIGYTREVMPLPHDRKLEKISWYLPFCKWVQTAVYYNSDIEQEQEQYEND